jgi:hypothetical protein
VTAWVRWEYERTQTSLGSRRERFDAAAYLTEIDCEGNRTAMLAAVKYLDAVVVASDDYSEEPRDWTPTVPSSIGEDLANAVCSPLAAPAVPLDSAAEPY